MSQQSKDSHDKQNHSTGSQVDDAAIHSSRDDQELNPLPTDQVDDTQSSVDRLQQQVNDLTEALQRERADATNIRRRHDQQTASLRTVVKANVVRDLLPVIDNFERALKHVPKDLENNDYIKGVQGVVKQFEKTLGDIGVERIGTVGEPFDPAFHEAVSMDEGDGTIEVVSDELQSGYKLGKEIIRHAMVKVTLQ